MSDQVQMIFLALLLALGTRSAFACSLDSHCSIFEYCCKVDGQCAFTCKGRNCTEYADCARGEVCCSGHCQTGFITCECTSSRACGDGRSCCNGRCQFGYNCLGSSCATDSHCEYTETCCDGVCKSDYACTAGNLAPWLIIIIVTLVILVIGVPTVCIVAGIYCAIGPCKTGSSRSGATSHPSGVLSPLTNQTSPRAGHDPSPGTYPEQYPPNAYLPAEPKTPLHPGYYSQEQYPLSHSYGLPAEGVPYQSQAENRKNRENHRGSL